MKLIPLILLIFSFSCSTKPRPSDCKGATETVKLTEAQKKRIQGNVSQFLSDAEITQETIDEGKRSIWRFRNMPRDSVYYLLGLREGDAVYKTNLGEQKSSITLISDLSGIATGTTDCLYVKTKDDAVKIIKIQSSN